MRRLQITFPDCIRDFHAINIAKKKAITEAKVAQPEYRMRADISCMTQRYCFRCATEVTFEQVTSQFTDCRYCHADYRSRFSAADSPRFLTMLFVI